MMSGTFVVFGLALDSFLPVLECLLGPQDGRILLQAIMLNFMKQQRGWDLLSLRSSSATYVRIAKSP